MSIRIFDQTEPWPDKVNFVGINNMVVGYDMEQDCCEYAGWYITEIEPDDNSVLTEHGVGKPEEYKENPLYKLDGFNFDPEWSKTGRSRDLDEGGWVAFKMVLGGWRRGESKPRYLVLFNCHNGYYGHGFSVMTQTMEGTL